MRYKDIPIIELCDSISKEEWFTLADGAWDMSTTKHDYDINGEKPESAQLKLQYNGTNVTTIVIINNGKFKMRVGRPDYACSKTKRSSTVHSTIKKIREMLGEVFEKIDKRSEIERADAKSRQELLEKKKAIVKASKLPIEYGKDGGNGFSFCLSQNFRLYFTCLNWDANNSDFSKFRVINIQGRFNLEQITKLADFLSECPQAVADRILKGK